MWIWIVLVIGLALLLYLLERELYFYEGVHLGPRVQGWLYDRWAKKYDLDKQHSQANDAERLAQPMIDALKEEPAPIILDYATGTGRLPLALLQHPDFTGHIIAVDLSKGMLEQAEAKLAKYEGRYELVHLINLPLPYPDNYFNAVSCMEALELMPNIEEPLAELFRVLKPGGVFMSSRGTEASGRRAKVHSREEFERILNKTGFEQVEITPWWKWFDHVWAHKPAS